MSDVNSSPNRPYLWVVIALALLHMVLACWYSSSTPYRTAGRILSNRGAPAADIGAPDERQHANYVARLVEGRGFPVFNPDPKSPGFDENYEFHQPPTYYVATAGFAKLIGLTADQIRSSEGKAVRGINVVFGAWAIFGVFYFGLWGFGRADAGAIAAAFTALLPMNIALSGAVSNDPLLIAEFAWALSLIAKGVREGWTVKLAALTGAVIGFSILTKTTGVALLPILGLAALLRRPDAKSLVGALVPAVVLALPWLLRNNSLYGDPFALKAFQAAFVNTAQANVFVDGMGLGWFGYLGNWVAWWTARSFVGAFGYMDIWLNEAGSPIAPVPNALYRLVLVGLGSLFLGWILSLKTASDEDRKVNVLGVVTFVIVTVLFLRFNLQYFQAQGRYLFPALAPISAGVAVGALRFTKQKPFAALLAVALPLIAIALLAGSILGPEFAKRT